MSGFAESTFHWPQSLVHQCSGTDGCCNGFFRMESISTAGFLTSTLDNDIHSIFGKRNFQGMPLKEKEPALRLASQLIEASLPFWHSLIFGKLVKIGPNDDGGTDFELQGKVRELKNMDSGQKNDTHERLAELANYIKFGLNDSPAFHQTERFSLIKNSDWFKGHHSIVYLGKERVQWMWEDVDDTDEAHMLLNYLMLAKDLCHELAHAVLYARWPNAGDDNDYTFFSGLDVAEEGLAWEARTFGGLFRTMTRSPHIESDNVLRNPDAHLYEIDDAVSDLGTNMICMTEWPNLELVKRYQGNGWPLGVKLPNQVADPYMIWNVPFSYIAKLFCKEFWTKEYIPGRSDALHVPRTTGYRYRYVDPKASTQQDKVNVQAQHVPLVVTSVSTATVSSGKRKREDEPTNGDVSKKARTTAPVDSHATTIDSRETMRENKTFRGVPAEESPKIVPPGFWIEPEGGLVLPVGKQITDVIQ